MNWLLGAHAVYWLMNGLVHPDAKPVVRAVYFAVSLLNVWFIFAR